MKGFGTMPKKMICLAPDELLRIGKAKGMATIAALSEASGVDRKTLRLANKGQPVKDTKLQEIADNLKVPLSHFRRADGSELSQPVEANVELVLKPITAKTLRELVETTDEFSWNLNVSAVSDDLQAQLLNLETMVNEWHDLVHGTGKWKGKNRELQGQIAKVRTVDQVDAELQALSKLNVRLFGDSYVQWFLADTGDEDSGLNSKSRYDWWTYLPSRFAIISVEGKGATIARVSVDLGDVPPTSFDKIPERVDRIFVGKERVWTRIHPYDDDAPLGLDDSGIPIWSSRT